MPAIPTRDLTEDEEEWVLNDIYESIQINQSIEKIGFKTRRQFSQYVKTKPDLRKKIVEAMKDSCVFIENDMLNIHRKTKDHKIARIMMEAFKAVLVYRDPKTYSQKVDLNVTQTLEIGESLIKARERLTKTVTEIGVPAAIEIAPILETIVVDAVLKNQDV